jgi:hypothetical protein
MGSRVKTWAKSLWSKLNADLKALWQQDKLFVVVFGAIIAIIKFRQALIGLLIWSSKNLFNSTTQTTNSIQQQENADNNQANQLINDANQLQNTEKTTSDDWYKGDS